MGLAMTEEEGTVLVMMEMVAVAETDLATVKVAVEEKQSSKVRSRLRTSRSSLHQGTCSQRLEEYRFRGRPLHPI